MTEPRHRSHSDARLTILAYALLAVLVATLTVVAAGRIGSYVAAAAEMAERGLHRNGCASRWEPNI